MSKVLDAFEQTLNLCNEVKEKAISKQEFNVAAHMRDIADGIKRLQKEAQRPPDPPSDTYVSYEEVMKSLLESPKGKRINFHNLPKRTLVEMLIRIRHLCIDGEDAGDVVLDICEILNVSSVSGDENEREENVRY